MPEQSRAAAAWAVENAPPVQPFWRGSAVKACPVAPTQAV